MKLNALNTGNMVDKYIQSKRTESNNNLGKLTKNLD
jgi:hypothetical protein